MADLIVLVHAPVLGPASWRPVGRELSRAGCQVTVPELTGFSAGPPPYAPRLIQLCAEQVALAAHQVQPDRIVLVVHSGAGPFAGHLASAVQAASVAVVFTDAGLPDQAGASPVVDGRFLPYLREIASDGVVPPWQEWWPGADPAEIFPNETARAAVMADTRPLPLAFFEEELPPAPGSQPLRNAAYLLLSDSYTQEADEARRRGWPVTEIAGNHLSPLTEPAQVAAAIQRLAGNPPSAPTPSHH